MTYVFLRFPTCHQPLSPLFPISPNSGREKGKLLGKLWKQLQLPRLFKSFNSNSIQLLECQFGFRLVGHHCSPLSPPSHPETCGSPGKTQSQHLRATSESSGTIITRGSQGRLYLSVYLNFCNNLRQMRNVSVFSWAKLRHPISVFQQSCGAPFCFCYLCCDFCWRCLQPQKSNANCNCRSRRPNFTFPKFHLQTFRERLQIECLIATGLHSRCHLQHMRRAVGAFGPLYWPVIHSEFPSLVSEKLPAIRVR